MLLINKKEWTDTKQHHGLIAKKKNYKQMKLERRVHTVYNLYAVIAYSKVIYSCWNLLSDYLKINGRCWL